MSFSMLETPPSIMSVIERTRMRFEGPRASGPARAAYGDEEAHSQEYAHAIGESAVVADLCPIERARYWYWMPATNAT